MTEELQDRVTIVTGAGGAMGRAVALAAVASGARVVVTDVNEEGLNETAEQAGDSVIAVAADVSTAEGVQTFVDAALERPGRVSSHSLTSRRRSGTTSSRSTSAPRSWGCEPSCPVCTSVAAARW
jgi:NAD(P)-dependent dehydrogenase (short-subunit alcohol dehydrogenase family)